MSLHSRCCGLLLMMISHRFEQIRGKFRITVRCLEDSRVEITYSFISVDHSLL